ncbi:MAG: IS1 family transposase [Acidobacteriota bacterium]
MNLLNASERVQVIKCLCEGMSIRSTVRVTGVAKNTVVKLLVDMGEACADLHDRIVRHVKAKRLQCDEIWSFVGAKQKNASLDQKAAGWGDVWTWTAIDADSKLCVSYLVGGRDTGWATDFAWDIRQRVVGRPQITTDAHRPYLAAIEIAFGENVDYAVLHKIYGASGEPEARYSPARCIGSDMKTVIGSPDYEHVSTSYVERQNLTMRMSMRRFTRLTNGFSKKLENHAAAISLYFAYYNFCRIHQTLRVTPAMEAGLTDHPWEVSELVELLPEPEAKKRGPYKPRAKA